MESKLLTVIGIDRYKILSNKDIIFDIQLGVPTRTIKTIKDPKLCFNINCSNKDLKINNRAMKKAVIHDYNAAEEFARDIDREFYTSDCFGMQVRYESSTNTYIPIDKNGRYYYYIDNDQRFNYFDAPLCETVINRTTRKCNSLLIDLGIKKRRNENIPINVSFGKQYNNNVPLLISYAEKTSDGFYVIYEYDVKNNTLKAKDSNGKTCFRFDKDGKIKYTNKSIPKNIFEAILRKCKLAIKKDGYKINEGRINYISQ